MTAQYRRGAEAALQLARLYGCRTAILSGSELEPLRPILRCEIAQMLYNLLLQTPLLK